MSGYRLSSGGLIDRSASLSFQFDGKGFKGHPGDTLASALIASGETLLGRSFKYHRPRGVLTAGPEEPNALVELRTGARKEPNTRSTTIELYDGLEATSQNRWPSLKRDFLSINQLAGPMFVGGFYYKTFMWPAALWEKLYEPLIRRAAGMGKVSGLPDPDSYDKAYAFCDVLVIGGGPTGLAAALAAARAGARVILCDDDFQPGGRLLSERQSVDGMPGAEWAAKAAAELAAMPEVRILRRTQVFGVYDGMVHGALERVCDHLIEPAPHQPRQRMWKLVSKRTILAAGAVERQLVFGGNDKPGVMLAAGVRSYLNRYGVSPGKKAAVFTTTDDGWRTAADLTAAGVNVAAVVDARSEVSDAVQALAGGARTMLGSVVLDARGGLEVSSIDVSTGGKSSKSFDVDLLAVSGGWNPQVALSTHLGSKPVWSDDIHSFIPGTPPPGMTIAGAAAGRMSLVDCLNDGTRLGAEAAASLGLKGKSAPKAPKAEAEATSNAALWRVTASKTKSFVDQQHDVTAKDIEIAAHEGYQSVEHLKRYTTLGMATDQGKTSNVNGHALMAGLTGRTMQQAGTTMARPPHLPVAIGAFGGSHRGQHFRPARLVSSHAWAEQRGAVFVDAGQWKRAQWFPLPGENDWLVSVSREVVATRKSVGICDVSTLGKIDVQGPDAGVFLDRLYVNTFSTLAVGKARYGLMLREDGLVLDDGTAARLAPEHYMVTTTTANAARVMQHMEYCRQVLWPELDVQQVSVTEQWAQYAVAGPNSRKLLEAFFGGALDISNEAVPYMGVAQTVFRGVPLRLFRLSFSGEMAYEIAVPARYGEWLIEALMAAGEAYDVVPYGTEALGVMRVEKGHVGGNELNGTTTVTDIGLGKMASKKKDYIGRTLAGRPGLVDPDRPAFVGFKAVDRSRRLRSGAHFLSIGAAATAKNDEGYMTSVAYSPMLECWVGLGFIKNGPARIGQRARAYDALRDQDIEVEICSPIFFDPEGARLHG